MKKLIYFFLVCCWGCMLEDENLSKITPSSEQQRSALALFFEQKLQSCSQTRSADSEVLSDSHTRLTDRVRLGYSPIYGGYYFVVPLQRKSTSTIDAALVYPLTDGEDFTLTSALKTPQLLDKTVLDTVTNSCLFLLSNKFLAWKKQGLSVDSALYGYAESLDGRSIFTPSSNKSSRGNSTRSLGNSTYEAIVEIEYELDPYSYVENGEFVAVLPAFEKQREVFYNSSVYMDNFPGLGECEFYGFQHGEIQLRIQLDDPYALDEAIAYYMLTSTTNFQNGYFIEDLSYHYHYHYTLYRESYAVDEGSGEGGGNSGGNGGGNSSPNPENNSTTKPSVNLTDVSKFVGLDLASNNCWAACTLIMQNYGIPPGSRLHVYRLLAENQTTGELYHYGNNPTDNYARAIACIDRHLDAGRPIVVGVNHSPQRGINENVTDHFIVITGRGYDANRGMYYYTYMETGRYQAHADEGCDTMTNRLYYDPTTQTFQDPIAGAYNTLIYDVSQVRPNDGINLEETESY